MLNVRNNIKLASLLTLLRLVLSEIGESQLLYLIQFVLCLIIMWLLLLEEEI